MSVDTPLRLVVFDCDGTLVDSAHTIVAAMVETWRAYGLDRPPAPRAVREVIGLPLQEAIARLYPEGDAEDHRRLTAHYRNAFRTLREAPDHDEPLYPGVVEALDALARTEILLGVATGKSRRGLLATLRRHGLHERFAVLKTADDGPGKPNPDILLDAIAEAGAVPETTAMVGDTVFDMEMATKAGAAAIGVNWGYHEAEELHAAGARCVLRSFDDLLPALAGVWGESG